jgi:hypothetical protein
MNVALSFLISAGITAFGLWTSVWSIEAASSPIGFTLMGLLAVTTGSISFYGAWKGEACAKYCAVTRSKTYAITLRLCSGIYRSMLDEF